MTESGMKSKLYFLILFLISMFVIINVVHYTNTKNVSSNQTHHVKVVQDDSKTSVFAQKQSQKNNVQKFLTKPKVRLVLGFLSVFFIVVGLLYMTYPELLFEISPQKLFTKKTHRLIIDL